GAGARPGSLGTKRRHSIMDATGSSSQPLKRLCQQLGTSTDSTLQLVESSSETDRLYAPGFTHICAPFERAISSLMVRGSGSLYFTISGKLDTASGVPDGAPGTYRSSMEFDIFTRNLTIGPNSTATATVTATTTTTTTTTTTAPTPVAPTVGSVPIPTTGASSSNDGFQI